MDDLDYFIASSSYTDADDDSRPRQTDISDMVENYRLSRKKHSFAFYASAALVGGPIGAVVGLSAGYLLEKATPYISAYLFSP